MKWTSLLPLVLISVFFQVSLESGGFLLVNEQKKYSDAKSYCRNKYTDLATIHNLADMNALITLLSKSNSKAWIGLELGSELVWHWVGSDQNTHFLNWKPGGPQILTEEACAVMDENGLWSESDCGTSQSFVCQGNASVLIFVNEPKTWRDAQSHCLTLSSGLVSIPSAEENKAVLNMSAPHSIWIGLFRDPWKWSDGSNSSFRFWGSSQPSYIKNQDCVVSVSSDQGRWSDLNCNNPNSFICYENPEGECLTFDPTLDFHADKPSNVTGIKQFCKGEWEKSLHQLSETSNPAPTSSQTTQTNITTNQLSTSMTTISQNPSQGFTTSHSTVAATDAKTDPSTQPPTSTSGLAAPNTTDFVSHPSSTELNTPSTEMAATPTQKHPKTTVSVTTSQVGTSAESTTQSLNVESLSDNLILIQKNMTWIEALSYCRENHADLVHITSKDIQDKVAQKTQLSTSLFVWLGLRYSCNFKFWFWAGSSPGCYQNWAPGEGPEGVYLCGVSGAIEATGGQQWVGLPETEELNFICSTCSG